MPPIASVKILSVSSVENSKVCRCAEGTIQRFAKRETFLSQETHEEGKGTSCNFTIEGQLEIVSKRTVVLRRWEIDEQEIN